MRPMMADEMRAALLQVVAEMNHAPLEHISHRAQLALQGVLRRIAAGVHVDVEKDLESITRDPRGW